ncbi:ATPase [Actinorhabdospora filicis]|uniref:histidine kinase n=1 Tax=Actinorhabdospora filicis TaxID=1785913 RepID=A0A9W6WBT5_9ACTN|nr:ATP-binding protein [Actinorhabdospora filicis]GLZ79896.1 ATPase [Actinorhabdospora filicis]
MRRGLTLAGQLLALQLGIVLLVVGAVAAVSIAESDADFRGREGARLRSVGENLAVNSTVRLSLSGGAEAETLATAAESARAVSGATYVHIADATGRLLTGPDAGRAARLGESDALTGRSWVGVVDDGSAFLVAHVPVLDEEGDLIGLVVVGRSYPTVPQQLANASSDLLTYLAVGAALGVAGSLLLSRRVKRQTLGLEPAEITGLWEHREAMLHGIREGVVGTDTADRITLINDEAARLLGIPDARTGVSVHQQELDPHVRDVLTGRVVGADRVVLAGDKVVVMNRQPVLVRGRRVGSVTTLRDRTELTALRRELDRSRHTTDTLRAQAHEFANRLHTIAGLVELGEHDEVVRYITRVSEVREEFNREVTRRVNDPSVAALLIAKGSVALEQGASLRLAEDTDLPALDDAHAADVGTVLGNLVDNALEAIATGGWTEVALSSDPDGTVSATVTDSGPGVPPELAEKVFRQGYTTKSADKGSGQRGLGLALTRMICARRGGDVRVENGVFVARIPR